MQTCASQGKDQVPGRGVFTSNSRTRWERHARFPGVDGSFILHVLGKKDVILKIFTLAMNKVLGAGKVEAGAILG